MLAWRSRQRIAGWRGTGVLAALVTGVVPCIGFVSGCSIPGRQQPDDNPSGRVSTPAEAATTPRAAESPEAAKPVTSEPSGTPVAVETAASKEVQEPLVEPAKEAAPKELPPPEAAIAGGDVEVVCPESGSAQAKFFFSPAQPQEGKPLRVVAVAEGELVPAALAQKQSEGWARLSGSLAWGGPPYAWTAMVDAPAAGTHQFLLASKDAAHPHACGTVTVVPADKVVAAPAIASGAWTITRAWNHEMENLYSAWIARLFLVDVGAKAGWRPLHQVLRDPKRNILYGYLGLREDDADAGMKVYLTPDCADTPFFLRAYFSWKMGLPFAVRSCLRGDWIHGPICEPEPVSNLDPKWDDVPSVVDRFNRFVGLTVANTVHSGTVRTVPEDGASDLYPVALSREALRPGVTYADPNGHVLVLVRWVPGTEDRMGMLLAVDAHPDLTVSHKRFSKANFFFDPRLPTGGFKAFRPAIVQRGKVRFMTNAELAASPDYGNRSLDQYSFTDAADFYRTVDKLLNPIPLDPVKAYRSQMEALIELLEERVSSVQVGVDYQKLNAWATIEMPDGGAIFETVGPWEDYSTPARDLRLLLTFDALAQFPDFVRDNSDIFKIPAGKSPSQVRSDLLAEWDRSKDELSITYSRTDGTPWTLTLGQLVERTVEFEQAYNPNDCVEARWGARRGSTEYAPCVHHAPFPQQRKMEMYRVWHAERRRPSAF
ncbi:MAG: hypothetical protein HY905_23055 [Deltaproteobacteria bacterium]|nr:hypothetical protein [Deltaproteobacteria bacterium]